MGHDRKPRVLVVDDDAIVAGSIAEFLRLEGHDATHAIGGEQAWGMLRDDTAHRIGAVITDAAMPGVDGGELLRRIRADRPDVAVVMLTGFGTIESAVDALRLGAVDYLTKPVVDQELRLAVERALQHRALIAENARLREQLDDRFGLDSIIGSDPRMRAMYELIDSVAPARTTVLMSGESGTGKSLVAHAIHHRSTRRDGPYVELSCGSIPETLLESELFGHVKGAFTGAHADKPGRFLRADGGTLFLDEINSASPAMQLKLLRVLQERRFEPVGSTETIEVDARVILASNQPLEELVASGAFRQDLYYRINVVKIELPPLRERVTDIPLLAEHFLSKYAAEASKAVVAISPEAIDLLRRYDYPGNVRELENIVHRAVVLTAGQTITPADLPAPVRGEGGPHALSVASAVVDPDEPWEPMPLDEALRGPERAIILRALRANDWSRQRTADQLGINRTTLYKKMKVLGIDPGDLERAG